MWSLKIQLLLTKAIVILLTLGLLGLAYKTSFSIFNPIGWKILQSWTLLEMENANFWQHFRVFGALFILAFSGFPSTFLLFIGMFLWRPFTATVLVIIAHFISTCILVALLRKSEFKLFKVESDLVIAAKEFNLTAEKLALFSRIFFTLPLRTSDRIIAELKTPNESYARILGHSLIGITIRTIPQSLWVLSFINFIINFRPYPNYDISMLMLYSALIVGWFLWPRIPELMPSREDVGEFLLEINKEREFSRMLKKTESHNSRKPSTSMGF